MEEIRLHRMVHFIPPERRGAAVVADLAPRPVVEVLERDERLVGDPPRGRETVVRRGFRVVGSPAECGIEFDRRDLLEIHQPLEDRGLRPGRHRDQDLHAVRMPGREAEAEVTADRGTDRRMENIDAQVVEQADLRVHDIRHPDHRKIRPPAPAASLGSGSGRTVATADVIGADDKIFPRVQRLARPDEIIPPPHMEFVGPAPVEARDIGVDSGRVLAAGHRVEDKNRIRPRRVQFAIRLVGEREPAEGGPAAHAERRTLVVEKLRADAPDGLESISRHRVPGRGRRECRRYFRGRPRDGCSPARRRWFPVRAR